PDRPRRTKCQTPPPGQQYLETPPEVCLAGYQASLWRSRRSFSPRALVGSCHPASHLDDPCFPAADEDLRDRLRERDYVRFFQPVCRIDPRERRQVLEHVDEDMVLEARGDRDSFRVLRSNDFHPLWFFLRSLGSR